MKRINSLLVFLTVVVAVVLLSNLSVFAVKKYKPKKPVIRVEGRIVEVDASGTVVGAAFNLNNPNDPPFLLYTLTNLGNVYASGYADLPCPNSPNFNCYGINNGFRTQIPASACDGNPHGISVYADANRVIGFNTPIAQKSFVCYRADSPDKIPDRTPVIFIPGIGGSVLAERNADGTETVIYPDKLFSFEGLNDPTAGLNRLDLGLNPKPDIIATDALRRIQAPIIPVSISNVYGQFIDELKFQGEHTEYEVAGIPERRSSDCQAEQQRSQKPTFFVFGYDWRLSNSENSAKLYDYVQCVQRFYPGTNINIVTHSMGGLVARRYLLDHILNHHVEKLVTIAAPWLGAPKALNGILTGEFFPLSGLFSHNEKVKRIALRAKGIHELLPSKWYFDLGGRPLKELVDANENGIFPEIYDEHSTAVNWLDTSIPFNVNTPYKNSKDFHEFPDPDSQSGQDDWRQDVAGVEYFHIWGQLAFNPLLNMGTGTINQVIIFSTVDPEAIDIREKYDYRKAYGNGDGTVPTPSASRSNGFESLYFLPGTEDLPFTTDDFTEDSLYSHNGLLSNPDVIDEVLVHLEDDEPESSENNQSNMSNLENPKRPKKFKSREEHKEYWKKKREYYKSEEFQQRMYENSMAMDWHFLDVSGVERLDITDPDGNTNTPLGIAADLAVPDVLYSYGTLPEDNYIVPHEVRMPANKIYDVKFRATSEGIRIEMLRGPGRNISVKTVRYLDLHLPVGVMAWLKFTPQGVEDLRYDADGDGIFESTLAPTYSVTGDAAKDITPPIVRINTDISGNTATVTITATDEETGVKYIKYRTSSGRYQLYTVPFTVNLNQVGMIYALAEDNVGNRLVSFKSVDFTPPTSTANTLPVPTSDGWHNSSVDVSFSAVDDTGGSGVQEIVYSASGATQIPETSLFVSRDPFAFPRPSAATDVLSAVASVGGEGITTVTYFARDKQGNAETPKTLQIKIDYEPSRSSAMISVNGNTANISLSATDVRFVYNPVTEIYEPDPNFPVSGVDSIRYSIDDEVFQTYSASFSFSGSGGTHTIRFYSVDNAGNIEAEQTEDFTLTAPPITSMSVSPILECVAVNVDGTYTARFGYESQNTVPVTISIEEENKFTPVPKDRGQPTVFQPGRIYNAFEVIFNGNTLTWHLTGPDGQRRNLKASRNSARCQ